MAKKSTIKTSVHKRLEQLGTSLLNQASNSKALEEIGTTQDVESLRNSLNNIFDELGASDHNVLQLTKVLDKAKGLLSLIKSNIAAAKSSKNFSMELMANDLADVNDIVFRIESIKSVSKDQLTAMNNINTTHVKLQKLIKPIGRS